MRIALFGGTFDPIHHGHLILARDAIEELTLDHVIFIPAALSPHKPGTAPAAAAVRREMLAEAIADEDQFFLEDCELHRPQPSYTIETVEMMRSRFPAAEFFYLLGRDHLPKLDTWHRIEELQRLVRFVVFNRGSEKSAPDLPSLSRRLDISATEVRRRVARGLPIRYLVPPPVEALIARHNLYREASY